MPAREPSTKLLAEAARDHGSRADAMKVYVCKSVQWSHLAEIYTNKPAWTHMHGDVWSWWHQSCGIMCIEEVERTLGIKLPDAPGIVLVEIPKCRIEKRFRPPKNGGKK